MALKPCPGLRAGWVLPPARRTFSSRALPGQSELPASQFHDSCCPDPRGGPSRSWQSWAVQGGSGELGGLLLLVSQEMGPWADARALASGICPSPRTPSPLVSLSRTLQTASPDGRMDASAASSLYTFYSQP